MDERYEQAADTLRHARNIVAFTGAGISVESGIPPFRGPTGLWSRYSPEILDIDFFMHHPETSWKSIREIFYEFMQNTRPNAGHRFLAWLEAQGRLQGIITQNIDHLHQSAGSRNVVEFHGSANRLACTQCRSLFAAGDIDLQVPVPECPECGGLLKPDFVFFGESIPPKAYEKAVALCRSADCMLIIGTTGEIMPASRLPYLAPEHCTFIEINIERSAYTETLTPLFLQDKVTVAARKLKTLMQGK
jgi:NAD-dependent deacetylase